MSRRRDAARVLTIPVVCPHPGRRAEVVTRIRVQEGLRDAESRSAALRSTATRPDGSRYQAEPLDNWSGEVDDPMPHTPTVTVDRWTVRVKVRVRCRAPGCRHTLEASPELADRIVDALLNTDTRRVELRTLVALVGGL